MAVKINAAEDPNLNQINPVIELANMLQIL